MRYQLRIIDMIGCHEQIDVTVPHDTGVSNYDVANIEKPAFLD
jgi:hypothetical protein